ncbi:hypothetical protein A9G11_03335 [Gilliamella sp. wkB108]|uniref:DUF4878 domain-containing protein n=1 Tax=Gilliamella sp. wkB108 TaxID=3120256 RepID=UPI00080E338C|nr:DUF4878 domain-containing protein [Gilliamella apicola]OCG24699.1 hypothetical protein A9G11_03335 [Gilliamella apicola]
MKLVIKYISVFLLALVVTACSQDNSSTPEKAAEKFTKAMYDKDMDTVISMIYIPKEEQKDNLVNVKDLLKSKFATIVDKAVEEANSHGGLDKVECSPAEYINDNKTAAKTKVAMIFKDGTKNEGDMSLVKVDGKWLVSF